MIIDAYDKEELYFAMNKALLVVLTLATAFALSGCDDSEKEPHQGKLEFRFLHLIEDEPVSYKELRYTNAAGNHYEITEIQWFISDVTLIAGSGAEVAISSDGFSHYIDSNLPETANWQPSDRVPAGKYTQIKFIFGLKGEKNTPGIFPDLPESNMIWPYVMGGDNGGYHYMKLNGFWINNAEQRMPFNFHLGVGQIYDSEEEVVEFVQNWFEVTLPLTLDVRPNQETRIELVMNVESWFDSPIIYDHNQFGSMIMKNQEAMGIIAQNGKDAFDVNVINSF